MSGDWCEFCTKRSTRRVNGRTGAFSPSYYCEECYARWLYANRFSTEDAQAADSKISPLSAAVPESSE